MTVVKGLTGFAMVFTNVLYAFALLTVVHCNVRICGKTNHNNSNGELSPHEGKIPAGHDCTWHIFPESFNIPEVFMVVEDFELDASDRFVINKHDGDKLFGPLNGKKDTFTILTGYLALDVLVDTNGTPSQDRKFKTYYTTNNCYYLMEGASGTMTSPIYNAVSQRKTVKCRWQFRKFKQVSLPRTVVFETFNLINSTLTVQGSKSQDGVYSGTKLPGNIVAFGETEFILDLNTSVPGEIFSFRYGLKMNDAGAETLLEHTSDITALTTSRTLTKHESACGLINLQALRDHFSPKDETIIADHTCIWTISSQRNEIYVVIEEYDVIGNDKFVMRQSSAPGPALFGPYFGEKVPHSILTDENTVDVSLKTSSTEPFTKRHFRGFYSTADCNYPITDNSGTIFSPVYKTVEQKKTACSWIFNNPDTSIVISISFDNYNIKSSQIEVAESINQDQIYKGSDGPFDILMKTNGKLTLEIDRTYQNETFSFTYKNVTPSCSNYIKIIGKESISLSFPPPDSKDITSFDCQWIIEGSPKSVLAIHFDEIHLADTQDLLLIKDGKTRASPVLVQITQNNQGSSKGSFLVSNTNVVWVSFSTHFPLKGSNFKINVNISEQGHHLHSEQNFTISATESGVDVIYFLEVEKDEQVVLTLFPYQNIPSSGVISAYNGFTVNSSLLINIKNNKPFYPVVSSGSKMMVIAKNFPQSTSVTLGFKGIQQGCHQVTLDHHGTFALSGNFNRTCSWAILPQTNGSQEILSLHLSSVALTPNDVIEVKQLDDNMTHVARITLKENTMPNIYLPAMYGAYITITRGSCLTADRSTAFSASAEVVNGCSVSIDINAGDVVYLTSPNYPDTYPFNSNCHWNLSTSAKNLYISFKQFQLSSEHCLKVHEMDGGDIANTITYNNSVVPQDKMFKNKIALELQANHCTQEDNTTRTSSGNGFLVEVFALDCGGVLGMEMRGTFNTPDYPNPVKENLLCIWKVEVPAHNDDESVNIISFNIQWSSPSTDKEMGLAIHDGPSLTSELFMNTSTSIDLLSKTNTLIFMYKQDNSSKSHSAVSIDFESRAGNSLCDNGIYMHPDWVCNGIDECGDFSDEKNCKGRAPLPPPIPPNPPKKTVVQSGYSSALFWSITVSAFIVGMLAPVLTAVIIKVIRQRRDQNYDSLPIYQ